MGNLKAQELRIGNLVEYRMEDDLDSRKEWWAVTAIDSEDINWLEKEEPETIDYRPIPLTEEWLLKFGFEEDETYVSEENPFLDYINGNVRISMPYFSFEYCDGGIKELKYVHQIQNLYFALTGTELEIKK
jgi:hypothetical protein